MSALKDFWRRVTGSPLFGLGLTFAIVLPPIAYASLRSENDRDVPSDAVKVEATIVAFHEPIARYFWNHRRFVVARTPSGNISRQSIWPMQVRGCEVGDHIEAYEKGFLVYLHPAPCD